MNGRIRTSGLEEFDGAQWYTVADVDRMDPFLMSLVSDGDRWMFVSSSGALTAGRGDANHALFPYVTDDRLHAAGGQVGPVTRLRVTAAGDDVMWIPFEGRPVPGARRCVSKSVVGDSVVFEEHRDDLRMRFRYRWSTSATHGFVRTATVHNLSGEPVSVAVLDGLVGILPYGLEPTLYQRLSNLTNAYKRSELVDPVARLAVYSLEAPVSDRPQPEEVLRATVVWSTGLEGSVGLDERAVAQFEVGADTDATLVTGRPGAYLVRGDVEIDPDSMVSWQIVADVGYTQSDAVRLRNELRTNMVQATIADETQQTRARLVEIMTMADAMQVTGDPISCAHHYANVTYNVMRGGVPLEGYRIHRDDLVDFVEMRNRAVASRHAALLASLPESIERSELLDRVSRVVATTGDTHLSRLVEEYLPFSFSRRHGDPSRPWNQFSIRVVDDAGAPVVYYEGNWRDLFQNWEALCASYPGYLPAVITLFVNASTADGYNPYRITRNGIDWEVPDPDDPWSNIGYWGDHQIVYLLRLLEAADRYMPGHIVGRLGEPVHTYADVPYRIAPYHELIADPKDTITYDDAAAAVVADRVDRIGGDGKLLVDGDGEIVEVTLLEKLLVAPLAKLSNFVPGGGIWMNTQRPEWNDANNALVGYGLSMVTLYHLRRYLAHLRSLVAEHDADTMISAEVAEWFGAVTEALRSAPVNADDAEQRRRLLDVLATAASRYRSALYTDGLSGARVAVPARSILECCDAALRHLDETIGASRRPDGLMQSYNLIDLSSPGAAEVTHLDEMLEGQVAALSSGLLRSHQQIELIRALFDSALYRADQLSFVLAPASVPPAFLDKNSIDDGQVDRNPLLRSLQEMDDRSLIHRDDEAVCRFAAELTTIDALARRLDDLAADPQWSNLVERHRNDVLTLYEDVFNHRSYVGRSASMYGYEGIGSVYWHMVSKLQLAVQEALTEAVRQGASDDEVEQLRDAYRRVRSGLGFNKTAQEFGAIPIDPYSHTPAHAGAQQPGMTGAVKEEILTRRRELGVDVEGGRLTFDTLLLREDELLDESADWVVDTVDGRTEVVHLPAASVGLTVCQVPVVVAQTAGDSFIELEFADGSKRTSPGLQLDQTTSASIFGRSGDVTLVRANLRSNREVR